MVRLEEVEDESFLEPKPFADSDADYSDTDSSLSSSPSISVPLFSAEEEETLLDRIHALKDMIPPRTRRQISDTYSRVSSYGRSGLWIAAQGAYAISVSALFVSVPFLYLFVEDVQLGEQEKEAKMREMGGEILMGSGSEGEKTMAAL